MNIPQGKETTLRIKRGSELSMAKKNLQ
jgi:hypothetical protein